jgi:hypothetical protein
MSAGNAAALLSLDSCLSHVDPKIIPFSRACTPNDSQIKLFFSFARSFEMLVDVALPQMQWKKPFIGCHHTLSPKRGKRALAQDDPKIVRKCRERFHQRGGIEPGRGAELIS